MISSENLIVFALDRVDADLKKNNSMQHREAKR